MRKDIEFLHRDAYLNERKKRWDMENKSANTIIETFTAYIAQKLPFLIKENIKFQRSNSLIASLFEFGYLVTCEKSKFAKSCRDFVNLALEEDFINKAIADQMFLDCEEIEQLITTEKSLDKEISNKNKNSEKAKILSTIPGIGAINASILSIKAIGLYDSAKDFADSLGIVPKQNTTGGKIVLGRITKQGDRYTRTMLIQAGRSFC